MAFLPAMSIALAHAARQTDSGLCRLPVSADDPPAKVNLASDMPALRSEVGR
jgi:hypothetical protein